MEHDTIAIVDYGCAVPVAERLRSHHFHTIVLNPNNLDPTVLSAQHVKGIILSDAQPCAGVLDCTISLPNGVLESGLPVLSIGAGMHALLRRFGGTVAPGLAEWQKGSEAFSYRQWCTPPFLGLTSPAGPEYFTCADQVTSLPRGFRSLVSTSHFAHALVQDTERRFYGFQFRPEFSDYDYLRIFAETACVCRPTWTMKSFLQEMSNVLQKGVSVYCPLTLEPANLVATALLQRCLGPSQLNIVFIKAPCYREAEVEQLLAYFPSTKVLQISEAQWNDHVDSRSSLSQLLTATHSKEYDGGRVLVSSSLGSDVAGRNVNLSLSPLTSLYQSEIIELGKELGLPEELLQPTRINAGPAGLLYNCYNVDYSAVLTLAAADLVIRQQLEKDYPVEQGYLLNVLLDGGDNVVFQLQKQVTRTNKEHVPLPTTKLSQLSSAIRTHCPRVCRILYDITTA